MDVSENEILDDIINCTLLKYNKRFRETIKKNFEPMNNQSEKKGEDCQDISRCVWHFRYNYLCPIVERYKTFLGNMFLLIRLLTIRIVMYKTFKINCFIFFYRMNKIFHIYIYYKSITCTSCGVWPFDSKFRQFNWKQKRNIIDLQF